MSFFATAKDRKTIFFSSHDVSKPDSGSYLSEVSVKYLTFVCFLGSAQMKLQGWSDWLQSCSRSVARLGMQIQAKPMNTEVFAPLFLHQVFCSPCVMHASLLDLTRNW